MSSYYAFLRAINVGGHTVKMAVLRAIFTELGFSDVDTFIASGNAVFSSDNQNVLEMTSSLETRLADSLGYPISVFIRTEKQLAEIENYQPFANKIVGGVYVGFLQNELSESVKSVLYSFNSSDNQFHIHNRELYWLCQTRFSESLYTGAKLEKLIGMRMTIRGMPTLQKMLKKYTPV